MTEYDLIIASLGIDPKAFIRSSRLKGATRDQQIMACQLRLGWLISTVEARRLRQLMVRLKHRPKTTRKAMRPPCFATTRAGGYCKAKAVWDKERDCPRNGRCRVHGGLA